MPNSIEDQVYNPPVIPDAAVDAFSWTGIIGTIVLFLAILVVSLWLIKRLNRYTIRNMQAPWVRVLDRQVLGGQQALYLIEIAGKIQVLGTTDHHITKIEEINDPDVVAEILEEIAGRPEEKIDSILTGISKRFKKKKQSDTFSAELERYLHEIRR